MPSKQVPADTNPQKNKAELQRVVLSVYQQRSMLTNTAAFHSLLNHFKSTCSEAPTKNASMAYRFVQKKNLCYWPDGQCCTKSQEMVLCLSGMTQVQYDMLKTNGWILSVHGNLDRPSKCLTKWQPYKK